MFKKKEKGKKKELARSETDYSDAKNSENHTDYFQNLKKFYRIFVVFYCCTNIVYVVLCIINKNKTPGTL